MVLSLELRVILRPCRVFASLFWITVVDVWMMHWTKWRGPGGKAALSRRTPRRPPGRVPGARSAVECGATAPLWSSIPDQLGELLRAGEAGGGL
jgi:hypothetical protein